MGHHHPAQATITLKDGRSYSGETSYARGYPDIPLTTEEILDKYRRCSGLVLSTEKIARPSEMVLNLEA